METLPAAFSVPAAARYLSISRSGLYRLINSGVIVPVKIGHRTVIKRVDADRLLGGCGAQSDQPRAATPGHAVTNASETINVFG